MIPELSKRPFRHPVPPEAISTFSHPWEKHHYHFPAWGRDARLYACNGWLAVRFFNFTAAQAEGPQTVVDRMQRLEWHDPKHEIEKAWRKLDDCTLDIFRDGLLPMWETSEPRPRFRWWPFVRINHGILVPAAGLQLISRLPSCEIYTGSGRDRPLAFRFRGGEGLLARLTHKQEADACGEDGAELCHIFPVIRD